MKIRTRIVILLAGIFIALETAHLSISTLLLQNSYDALEHKAETENNERIFRAFSGNINDLSSICLDWAEWDDMYNFITTRSPSFLRSSLNKDSLINNNLNAFYCIDLNGKVIWGMDYESGIEDGLQRKLISGKSISASHQFMRAITEGDLRGIYRFDKGDALIAAHPVLRSDKTGSPKGIIIMSRTINERMIQDIRGKTLNNFTIIKASDISNSGQPLSSKTSSEKTFFKNSGGRIYYYTPMRDISGQIVSYILRESKREISQSGQKTIRVAQMSLLAGGLAMMGIIILSLYRWVVTPLSNLLHQIKSIKTNGVFSNDLPVLHNDEIGSLTQEFNSLMHMTKHQTILLEEKNNLLEELARVDQLTKLYNRRHFDEALAREWKRSRREQKELSMLMIDIDLFKKFNDTYGHIRGDECLKKVSQAIKDSIRRPADIAARYGGEEFAVILPDTDGAGAEFVARQISKSIADMKIEHSSSEHRYVSISIGISTVMPLSSSNMIEWMGNADKALYLAKNEGRNCIRTAVEKN